MCTILGFMLSMPKVQLFFEDLGDFQGYVAQN
jgi:hypothetical protein